MVLVVTRSNQLSMHPWQPLVGYGRKKMVLVVIVEIE